MHRLGAALRRVPVPAPNGNGSRTTGEATDCPICKGAGWIRKDVPVGDPNFGRLFMCDCLRREIEERNLGELQNYSNLDSLQHLTFETFDPSVPGVQDAYQAAHDFVRDTRRWLVFYGGFGAGKTHLAAAIAHELIKRRSRLVFQVVPDLLDHLRASFGPTSEVRYDQLFEAVKDAEVLILDDLGEERPNSFAEEKLFQLVNHRYNRRLPTVVTTNREPERIDQRIWSRLNDQSLVTTVQVGAADYRLRSPRERRLPRSVKSGSTPRR